MFDRSDEVKVLAEHGRWIARVRDDVKVIEQSLRVLERRVAALEVNLVELTKLYSRLDLSLAPLNDGLSQLASKVDVLVEIPKGRGKKELRK